MNLRDALLGVRQSAASMVWQVNTLQRVARQTGMLAGLRWSGAERLLREALKRKVNISLIIRFHAANSPHRIALHELRSLVAHDAAAPRPASEDRQYSYFELNETIDRMAYGLHRRGVGAGSKVVVMMKNRPEFLIAQSAIARIGGATVASSWRSTAPELQFMARHSGARALLFDADIAEMVRAAAPGLEAIPRERMFAVGPRVEGFAHFDELTSVEGAIPDRSADAALVMYTSGTTGKPKGAVRNFSPQAIAQTFATIGETPMRAGGVHLAVCPLYHVTAFGFVTFEQLLGSTILVMQEFRPELFLEVIQRYRVTTTAVVPTMLHRVLELGEARIRSYDLSSLQAIFAGGAPLSGPLAIATMDMLGDKLYNIYGSTETGLVTVASPADLRAAPGTIGRPVPGTELQLVREDKSICGEGEVGELYVRSSLLVSGYHDDTQATKDSTLAGFFSVGDLARRDARGCYHIEGRKRDMIISGGVNVYPAEVEAALDSHPDVLEAAVIGVPDPAWGERVRAFVVLRPGASADAAALQAYCRERLAGPKIPREIVFLDAMPRNPTGKVLKRELATMQV